MADGQPIVIAEVEDPGRRLELAGSDLPPELPVGAEMRTVVTRYPGRGITSTQVMGTSEEDIVLQGVFNDVLQRVSGWAQLQTQRGRALLLRQRTCELTWGSTVVRRGRVKTFRTVNHRDSRVEYELVFEVDEADEPDQVAVEPQPVATAQDTVNALDALSDVLGALEAQAEVRTALDALL